MKKIEIVLKVLFLIDAICLIITRNIPSTYFTVFLIVSGILGIVLIINKKSSYGIKSQKKGDYAMRRIEGGILLFFSIYMLSMFIS